MPAFRRIFLLFIFCTGITLASAQIIEIASSHSDLHNQTIHVNRVYGNKTFPLDSLKISHEGRAELSLDLKLPGYLQLALNDTNKVEIIVNPSERKIVLTLDSANIQNGARAIESTENQKLFSYRNYSRIINREMKIFNSVVQSVNPADLALKQAFKDNLKRIERKRRSYLDSLTATCPTTYFTRSVLASEEPDDTTDSIEKLVYFKHLDFSDPSMLNCGAIPKKVVGFLQKHTEYTEEGFQESIDHMLSLAEANREVYDFTLNFLLELFDKTGPGVIFQYLADKYVLSDGCTDVINSESLQTRILGYAKIQTGMKAPEAIVQDSSGYKTSVYKILAQSNLTLLYFWSSGCPHCHNALKDLKILAETYDPKKLQIAGYSLDRDRKDWVEYLRKNAVKWPSYCDFNGWESDICVSYKVHKTPLFYVLDSEGVILHKSSDILQVTAYCGKRIETIDR